MTSALKDAYDKIRSIVQQMLQSTPSSPEVAVRRWSEAQVVSRLFLQKDTLRELEEMPK
jgi:hypothetical protein